jgi:hypothetical protein
MIMIMITIIIVTASVAIITLVVPTIVNFIMAAADTGLVKPPPAPVMLGSQSSS